MTDEEQTPRELLAKATPDRPDLLEANSIADLDYDKDSQPWPWSVMRDGALAGIKRGRELAGEGK